MNVESSSWIKVFSSAAHPLIATLARIFPVPADEPDQLRTLLQRIGGSAPRG